MPSESLAAKRHTEEAGNIPRGSSRLYALRMAGDDRPGYRQIADEIAGRIASGEYPVGSKLPGKIPLSNEYGVAVTTAERALRALADDGLTQPVRGAGSFVVSTEPSRPKTTQERLRQIEADIAAIKEHLGMK